MAAGSAYQSPPPIREAPDDTALDAERAEWAHRLIADQDDRLVQFRWQVEENIRMLAGQQWTYWHPVLRQFIDISEFDRGNEDTQWRKRPVFNHVALWFMLSHARATENPPILTFLPGPDRVDSQLADTMDTVFKVLWRETGMPDAWSKAASWLVASGRGHIMSTIEQDKGDLVPWIGAGPVPLLGEDGVMVDPETGRPRMSEQEFPEVPFGPTGEPFLEDEQGGYQPLAGYDEQAGEYRQLGEPHRTREGRIRPRVFSPLEVFGEWGPTSWADKRWHGLRYYATPDEVFDRFGREPEPALRDSGSRTSNELERMLYGTGFFAAASGRIGSQETSSYTDGLLEMIEIWCAPSRRFPRTDTDPGGRHLVIAHGKIKQVLHDSSRPANFAHTSPIRTFEFIQLPGRPSATTPLEILNAPQRAFNRTWAQIGEHVALATNPKPIIDRRSGIQSSQWNNQPGKGFVVTRHPNVPAVEWLAAPNLSADTWRYLAELRRELEFLGQTAGATGEPPTPDPSGELVKELRFNADRYYSPVARSTVEEMARLADDWIRILPVIWTQEKFLVYSGEDRVARTITVLPHLFVDGKVNIVPDVESMLPEGRGERQSRVFAFWREGAFGPPGDPTALRALHELSRMPHLGRVAQAAFGGVDRTMAEHMAGNIARGTPAEQLRIFEWYDLEIHIAVFEDIMKSPEFLQFQPEIQSEFVKHWSALRGEIERRAQEQMAQQLMMAEAAGQQQLQQQAQLEQIKAGSRGANGPARPMQQGPPSPPAGMSPDEMASGLPTATA